MGRGVGRLVWPKLEGRLGVEVGLGEGMRVWPRRRNGGLA